MFRPKSPLLPESTPEPKLQSNSNAVPDERPCLMSAPTEKNENTIEETIAPINTAAGEWLPDAIAPSTGPVAFVMDPYGINTLEVSEAQQQDTIDIPDSEEESEAEAEIESEIETEVAIEAEVESIEAEAQPEALAPLEFVSIQETDAQLASLSNAIAADEAAEQEKLIEQTAAAEAQLAREQAELLAAQIAEDQALAKAMAEEAQEIDPELLAALPQRDEQGLLDLHEMCSCIQALLFMLDKPVSAQKLQELLAIPAANPEDEPLKPEFSLIQEALTLIKDEYNRPFHGFELVEVAGGYQLRTKTGRAALAKKLAKVTQQRLSSGAMETLAIVAYKQPVLKEDVDKVRGVDSSHFIRGLLDKKLIAIAGRSDLPGRPMLYETTRDFLELFGLKDLSAMPPLHELEQMVPASQSTKEEDPRVLKMRTLVAEMNSDQTRLDYNPREDEVILKDIRERVSQIPVSTPYLEEQKAIEKAVAAAKAEGREIPEDLTLLLNKPEPAVVQASESPISE